MNQTARTQFFRQLHCQRPLILPNAWDAGSARLIEATGAQAIATTSAGVSWSAGRRDGQGLNRAEMLQAIRQIVAAVTVPVTADIEGGYGSGSPADVAATVRALVQMGVAGINLEDAPGRDGEPLLGAEAQAERIRAARAAAAEAGGDLVINARTDVFLAEVGAPETRLAEVVRRAAVYAAAGADGLFVPGLLDGEAIAELVRSIALPLNIMAMPGAPDVAELGRLGVSRVSVGPAIAQAALAATRRAAAELLGPGTYHSLAERLPFGEIHQLFPAPATT